MNPIEKYLVNRLNEKYVPRMVKILLEYSPPNQGEKWLEVGAGKGYLSHRIWEENNLDAIWVTDYDDAQVTLAREFFINQEDGIPEPIKLETADVLDLPYPDDTFDAVLASLVLHHVEDKFWSFENIPTAIDEILRVLRPNGRLYCIEEIHKRRIQRYLEKSNCDLVVKQRFFYIFHGFVYNV